LVFGLELFLKVANVLLELLFALFMLALESQNLVIGLTGLASVSESVIVGTSRFCFERFNGRLHRQDANLREFDFASH